MRAWLFCQARDCFRLPVKEGRGKSEGERGRAWLFSFNVILNLFQDPIRNVCLNKELRARKGLKGLELALAVLSGARLLPAFGGVLYFD